MEQRFLDQSWHRIARITISARAGALHAAEPERVPSLWSPGPGPGRGVLRGRRGIVPFPVSDRKAPFVAVHVVPEIPRPYLVEDRLEQRVSVHVVPGHQPTAPAPTITTFRGLHGSSFIYVPQSWLV